MLPEWIVNVLEKGGLWGAIVFVLLTAVIGLVAYVKSLQAKADKVYGYRLAERDTLNKTLSDSSKVLEGIIKANEDRNLLIEDQADLILRQSHAFELLKTSVLAQYDNIKDHNSASSMAVAAMADAIRALNGMLLENRNLSTVYVNDVKERMSNIGQEIHKANDDITKAIGTASQSQMVEMRNLLGSVTTIHRKRRMTPK